MYEVTHIFYLAFRYKLLNTYAEFLFFYFL